MFLINRTGPKFCTDADALPATPSGVTTPGGELPGARAGTEVPGLKALRPCGSGSGA